VQDKDIVAMEG